MIYATVMLGSLSLSSALLVGSPKIGASRMAVPMMASVGDTLGTMEGPEIFWGAEGPLQDPMKEESELKEYDTFSTFLAACSAAGVDLSQPDITVFAPANVACEEYKSTGGVLSKEVCAYHVVKGVVPSASIGSADLTTLEGGSITYRRMFRKDFVDNAIVGAKYSPPRSSYAADIKADNGVIHGINEVIYPGWSESTGGTGAVGDATRA